MDVLQLGIAIGKCRRTEHQPPRVGALTTQGVVQVWHLAGHRSDQNRSVFAMTVRLVPETNCYCPRERGDFDKRRTDARTRSTADSSSVPKRSGRRRPSPTESGGAPVSGTWLVCELNLRIGEKGNVPVSSWPSRPFRCGPFDGRPPRRRHLRSR